MILRSCFMGKILFIDVDGTLVDYDNQLPVSAVDAIRKARANEHKVYICTGRSKAEVYPNLWEIGLDGMIVGNGSYVEDHGKYGDEEDCFNYRIQILIHCFKLISFHLYQIQ